VYQTILVPVDGSDAGQRAVQHGHVLASRFDAMLALVVVVDTESLPGEAPESEALADLHQRADEILGRYAGQTPEAVDLSTIMREGDPVVEITAAADAIDADLGIAGGHRQRGITRFLRHPVTEQLLETLDRPLLCVRDEQPVPEPYGTVLFATDGRSGSRPAREHAIAIAAAFDATLHALYVVDARFGGSPDFRSYLEAEGERATGGVAAAAAESGVPVKQTIREGRPHEEIRALADDVGADLIVVGTQGRTGIDRFVVGSVARRVVHAGDVPVLAVRSREA
jgi:nucleotide-binding universal stress UspA family protein